MDYQFPQQLFPAFYNRGPPDLKHCPATWGRYDQLRPQGGSGPVSSYSFTSRHQVRGEVWRHAEPVPIPLLSPKNAYLWSSKPPNPLDFTEHMQNFFMDHCQDAFGCLGDILGENFNFKEQRPRKDSVHMWKVTKFMDMLEHKICQQSYSSKALQSYSVLLGDAVHAVPPKLLGALLHEELTEQRDRLLFSEGATGGALAFIPFSGGHSTSQSGCLLYPGNQGLDRLNFHTLELQHHTGSSSCVEASSSGPFSFQLKGPIRQISVASLFNDCCVGVRSDRLCGLWRFSESEEPRLLQVVNTREVATCVSVSPHVLGEVLVASESGAANLWTVGKGMQKVREEDGNLYFNAKSPWRWCEFSAHPRVVLYADRTGAELSDIRMTPASSHTLFRIGNTADCRSGERLILSRYLRDVHSFHHLITTQHSAYIMDERFPCMPMLKWDHMMRSPPVFCHVLPGSVSGSSAVGGSTAAKILLGSQSSQEITMLQYSGGRAEACFSRGPPLDLLRPKDSLNQLPVQIPHRLDIATNRLSSPAAGLTCIQKRGGSGDECICILQLTEAGDIFYQILEPEQRDKPGPPAAENEPWLQRETRKSPQPATSGQATWGSQPLISDTSSEEGFIGPTQPLTSQRFVPETPEWKRAENSDASSEESESERKRRRLKLSLQVIVNDDPEPDGAEEAVESLGSSSHVDLPEQQTPAKLSDGALATWKRWLQKLMNRSRKKKKPRPHRLQHFTVPSRDLLQPAGDEDPTEEEHVQSLRRDLRACMSDRSLLITSTEDLVPLPDSVDVGDWSDRLSQRLTESWQGEEAWRAWWAEDLGLNREEKVSALKRKRRREKEARRATGRRLELSGSFTSSVSYQSELRDFSDSVGWSSAASQAAWSDAEGTGLVSQLVGSLEQGSPRARTPATMEVDTPVSTPTTTPLKTKDRQGDQRIPSSLRSPFRSQTLDPESTPASQSQRRSRRPADDYLSSLFATQDEPSQHDGYFLDEGSSAVRPAPPPAASSSFSQLLSSQSTSQRGLRAGLSQDTWSGFSQSLSQSSQGRPGPSQTKKKKSRMGF